MTAAEANAAATSVNRLLPKNAKLRDVALRMHEAIRASVLVGEFSATVDYQKHDVADGWGSAVDEVQRKRYQRELKEAEEQIKTTFAGLGYGVDIETWYDRERVDVMVTWDKPSPAPSDGAAGKGAGES